MPSEIGNLYLVLFALSVTIFYLTVRQGRMSAPGAAAAGSVINSLFIFVYAIIAGDGLIQALASGLILGIFFAVVAATAAAYFRRNTRTAHVTLQNSTQMEAVTSAG